MRVCEKLNYVISCLINKDCQCLCLVDVAQIGWVNHVNCSVICVCFYVMCLSFIFCCALLVQQLVSEQCWSAGAVDCCPGVCMLMLRGGGAQLSAVQHNIVVWRSNGVFS